MKYGRRHRRLRANTVAYAYGKACVRCGRLLVPGTPIELDHTDDGWGYLGYSHASCNRRAGALKKQRLARERKRRRT